IEIDQGQRAWIVGNMLQVQLAMYSPESLASQLTLRIELKGPAECAQSIGKSADAQMAHAAQCVLEHAQLGQHADRVKQIDQDGYAEGQRPELQCMIRQQRRTQAQCSAERADLNFRLLFRA